MTATCGAVGTWADRTVAIDSVSVCRSRTRTTESAAKVCYRSEFIKPIEVIVDGLDGLRKVEHFAAIEKKAVLVLSRGPVKCPSTPNQPAPMTTAGGGAGGCWWFVVLFAAREAAVDVHANVNVNIINVNVNVNVNLNINVKSSWALAWPTPSPDWP